MKVGYYFADQNPHRDKSLGITNYSKELVHALVSNTVVDPFSMVSVSSAAPDGGRCHRLPWRTDHAIGRLTSDHLHPFMTSGEDVELWHYPKGFLPMWPPKNRPVVTTIHDAIIPYYKRNYPQSRSRFSFAYWLGMLRHSISRSDLIITVSETAKRQILDFAGDVRRKLPPIIVTFEGSSKERLLHENPTPELPKGDYVMAFVSPLPHKGTGELLAHWTNFLRQSGISSLTLKLVGKIPNEVMTLMRVASGVEHLPFQSEESLVSLIRNSRGVIVPSLIEGFGLPVLEAYYCGAPAMVVAGTACDEILSEPGLAFRMGEQDNFNQAMHNLLGASAQAVANKRSELHQKYNWNQVALNTLAAYRAALSL